MTGDVVDIHAHIMPVGLPDLAATTGDRRWPRLVPGTEAADIMCGPDRFRRVTQACWDTGARLAAMDASGVAKQVISPVPISLTYWADPAVASKFIRAQNDLIAEAASHGDGRLVALGGVPLQDVDRAIDELHRVTEELGMAGVEIDYEASTAAARASENAGIRSDNAWRFLFGEVTCQTPTS